jgi:putative hydrolase of the HAD superfamily
MIKALVFDFGNVICSFDNNIFLKKISTFTPKSEKELRNLIYVDTNITQEYDMGLLKSEEFYRKVSTLCNLSVSKEDFRKAFTEIFTPIRTTYALIRRLKLKYKIGLLSNTDEWHFEYGIKPIEIFGFFDAITLSYKVGVMKPDMKIFHDILNKLNLSSHECIYIDDLAEFVDVAKELGFKGIKYTNYEDLLVSLRKLQIQV